MIAAHEQTGQIERMIYVAFNPLTRKVERVFPEDEVLAEDVYPMYWSNTLQTYVTIPE